MAALVLSRNLPLECRVLRARIPEEMNMLKLALAASAAVTLCACGTQLGDRAASGAAIGAGAGVVFGGVGAIPGAIVGAGVGALTSPDDVNLGEPAWDQIDDEDEADDGEPL
jgi:osmotically inducible lipoprotein OsmB